MSNKPLSITACRALREQKVKDSINYYDTLCFAISTFESKTNLSVGVVHLEIVDEEWYLRNEHALGLEDGYELLANMAKNNDGTHTLRIREATVINKQKLLITMLHELCHVHEDEHNNEFYTLLSRCGVSVGRVGESHRSETLVDVDIIKGCI